MKKILFTFLCSAAVSFGQSTPPLQILQTGVSSHYESGTPKSFSVEVLNIGNKEANVVEYHVTWKDKLGRVTEEGNTEPDTAREPGRRTLRTGKKGTNYFGWNLLHSNDTFTVEVVTVKFVDGTLWEAPKK
jgi:hypothetical protein